MAEESVMDVVNAALEGKVPDEPTETEEVVLDEETGEETGEEVVEGEEGAEGEVGTEGEEGGEEESDADVAAEAAKLGVSAKRANGQFKSKEELTADVAAAKVAADKTVKPGEKPAEGKSVAKKEPDPINDPIPKDLKQETQQRIRTLIDRTKSAEETATKFETDFNYLVKGVQSTGASPEQYGETLSWLALFNSGDPAQQAKALELVENVADRLATMLGKERAVSDPLAMHPDLQAALKAGQITKQFATETARLRNGTTMRQELTTAVNTQTQQEQAAAQEKEQVRLDLNALEASLKATDPLYDRKKAAILPTVKVAFANMPRSKWKEAFQQIYREVRLAPVVRRVTTAQPMRANKSGGAAGGGAPASKGAEPKDGLAALNAALAEIGQ